MMRMIRILITSLSILWGLSLSGCGDDASTSASSGKKAKKKSTNTDKKKQEAQESSTEETVAKRPEDRPRAILTREDFGPDARDPFESYQGPRSTDIEPDHPNIKQRDVRLASYDFDDLSLVGIVRSGRNVRPRALFVCNDGLSKSVQQGEYFSRNEVLLAAVNRDYIEIEIVDEDLARGLNMARGERRAIYLKKE